MAISQSIFEVSFVAAAIIPEVLPVSIKFTILVLALIEITVYKFLGSLAIFHKILKQTFISTTILLRIDSETCGCS